MDNGGKFVASATLELELCIFLIRGRSTDYTRVVISVHCSVA